MRQNSREARLIADFSTQNLLCFFCAYLLTLLMGRLAARLRYHFSGTRAFPEIDEKAIFSNFCLDIQHNRHTSSVEIKKVDTLVTSNYLKFVMQLLPTLGINTHPPSSHHHSDSSETNQRQIFKNLLP